MSDLNDDLFSDLDVIEVTKLSTPPARTIPNLADGLRELGLFQDQPKHEQVVEAVVPAATIEPVTLAKPEPTVEIVPVVERVEPEAEPGANPPHDEEANEELAAELDAVHEVAPEIPAIVEQVQEPVLAQLQAEAIEQPKDQAPFAAVHVSPHSHHLVWILGGSVAICAIGGWILFGSTNKESPVHPPVPVLIKPPAATVVQPQPTDTLQVIAIEPMPAPAVVEASAPPTEPATAPQVKPTLLVPAVPKTPRATERKPVAKPKSEPQWQDEAMNKLDDFEKRL